MIVESVDCLGGGSAGGPPRILATCRNEGNTSRLGCTPWPEPTCVYDAIVIGAGISGLYMLYRLRELGVTARVFEAGTNGTAPDHNHSHHYGKAGRGVRRPRAAWGRCGSPIIGKLRTDSAASRHLALGCQARSLLFLYLTQRSHLGYRWCKKEESS
jgi:glycine/D-amino acid oxidase-like deaminating enzyme